MLRSTEKLRVDTSTHNAIDSGGTCASRPERDATPDRRHASATRDQTSTSSGLTSAGDRPRMPQAQVEFMGPEGLHPLITELEEKYSTPTRDFVFSAMMDADGLRERFEREDPVEGAFDFARWLAYVEMEQRWKKDIPPVGDELEDEHGRPEGAAFSLPRAPHAEITPRTRPGICPASLRRLAIRGETDPPDCLG